MGRSLAALQSSLIAGTSFNHTLEHPTSNIEHSTDPRPEAFSISDVGCCSRSGFWTACLKRVTPAACRTPNAQQKIPNFKLGVGNFFPAVA
jgi:hypothetical protein